MRKDQFIKHWISSSSWAAYWNGKYPSELIALDYSNTIIVLSWTNNGTQNYDSGSVEISTDQINYSEHTTFIAGATTIQATGLTGGVRYFFNIRYKKGSKYSEYSNVAQDITYPDIMADGNTVAWYKHDDLATITKDGSNRVSRWNDKLGSGRDLLQSGIDDIKPIWSENGVLFDGSNDTIKALFAFVKPEFIYFACRQLTWTVNDVLFDGGNNYGFVRQLTSTPNLAAYAGAYSAISPLTLGNWGIVRVLFNGANSSFQVNTNDVKTGNFGNLDMGGFTIGSVNTGTSGFSYEEVRGAILRKVADDAAAQTAIYNFLNTLMNPLPQVTSVASYSITGGARISWIDSGTNDVEIWASEDGGTSTYLATVLNGVQTYDDTRAVGKVMIYSVYAKWGVLKAYPVTTNITISEVVKIQSVQGTVVSQLTIILAKTTGHTVYLDWGNGTIVSLSNGQGSYVSNYTEGSKTYDIYISGELNYITKFYANTAPYITIDIDQLAKFTNLAEITISGDISGSLDNVGATVTSLVISGTLADLDGLIDNLPAGLTALSITSQTAKYFGSLSNLNEGLLTLSLFSKGIYDGLIDDLPSTLTIFQSYGVGGYSGNTDNLPAGLKTLYIEDCVGGTLTGIIAGLPAGLESLFIVSSIGGVIFTGSIDDLPATLLNLFMDGCGTLTGDIANLPAGINQMCRLVGTGNAFRGIIGDIGDLPTSIKQLCFQGLSLTGNLEELPASIGVLQQFGFANISLRDNGGNVTVGAGAFPVWADTSYIIIEDGLSTTEVDNLLIGMAATATAHTRTITLVNSNAARSAASDAAVATLQALGNTINTHA
jgi:hypothetical protein